MSMPHCDTRSYHSQYAFVFVAAYTLPYRHNAKAVEAEQLGARREGRFWVYDGHYFDSAGDVISFASNREA